MRIRQNNIHPDILKFPERNDVEVIVDVPGMEVIIERGTESVLIRSDEINTLVSALLRAKDLLNE